MAANYSVEEVEALVEGYMELRREQPWIMVRMCDLDLALKAMPPKYYQAVLLVGLIGESTRWVGEQLGVSHQTVWIRYQRGLVWLTAYLNGERSDY